jgi:ferredoxin
VRRLQGLRRRLQEANDNPAEFSTLDHLWDTPLDTFGYTFNLIKMYRNGTMEPRMPGGERLRLHEDLLHALRRPVLRFGLPGVGDDQGPGDRRRRLQPGQVHRLPLLRRRLPLRHSQVPVRLAHRPIGKCELCRHRHKDGHYSACAEVCPTGATLFGRTSDLLAEAKRRLAHEAGRAR